MRKTVFRDMARRRPFIFSFLSKGRAIARNVFLIALQAHNSNPYVSETHDGFRLWDTIPTSLHFLFILM